MLPEVQDILKEASEKLGVQPPLNLLKRLESLPIPLPENPRVLAGVVLKIAYPDLLRLRRIADAVGVEVKDLRRAYYDVKYCPITALALYTEVLEHLQTIAENFKIEFSPMKKLADKLYWLGRTLFFERNPKAIALAIVLFTYPDLRPVKKIYEFIEIKPSEATDCITDLRRALHMREKIPTRRESILFWIRHACSLLELNAEEVVRAYEKYKGILVREKNPRVAVAALLYMVSNKPLPKILTALLLSPKSKTVVRRTIKLYDKLRGRS